MSRLTRVLRSPLSVAVGVVLACLAGIGGALILTQSPQQAAAERAVPALPLVTAQIVRQQLADTVEVDCESSSTQLSVVSPEAAGHYRKRVVTAVGVKVGTVLSSGRFVASVSTRPLFAFVSKVPFFRDLKIGDSGADVRSLKTGLVAAGKLNRADGRFDNATLAAVRGIYRTAGWVGKDRFVADAAWAVPARTKVTAVRVVVGDVVGKGAPLVVAQSGTDARECRVPAGVDVRPGDSWRATADGVRTTVSVTRTGVDPETQETLATVTLPGSVSRDAQVTVKVARQASEGTVLAVPAGALYSTADSPSALRLVDGQTVREVPVATGVAAGGWVEVSGDGLSAGQSVQIRGR